MGTAAALILTAASQRQIVKAFRAEQAMSGPGARRLKDLGLTNSSALQGLISLAVIRRAGPERYFLDESLWTSRRHLEWRTVLRITMVVVLVAVAALIMIGI
jgi:hypothetical protein